MKKEFTAMKRILEEHLSSINENTSEIQALFDYLQEVELKVDKLSQRLDGAQLTLGQNLARPLIAPLNHTEMKVFLVLYTEEMPLSYNEIAAKASLPLGLVPECLSSLTSKGIPFQRSFYGNQLFLKLDPRFKELQAKENLVNLSLQSFL